MVNIVSLGIILLFFFWDFCYLLNIFMVYDVFFFVFGGIVFEISLFKLLLLMGFLNLVGFLIKLVLIFLGFV